ncbi:Gfo/Idh/MocA family protein [Endozoicomonas euniceicola]|uniref:Gfo/Idh/MocA family oxidoreductase n=1 Tax=Endozoicomonas euniceicola TaxID=1234143 RepID=A0ABY6GS92_9GAMM|nr:Gfo/Idh/MocA family oxidoreductase [Endozoicomonas euniceicola]UYM15622.1 Gfo/Idh/MocA family oxidoreductase [Endozoicomonas euniceicola]
MKPVTMVIIGAGSRGRAYARYALEHPEQLQIVAVAEPGEEYRAHLAEQHNIRPDRVYSDWQALRKCKKVADAVAICTQDDLHKEPAVAMAKKGYHLLLEKPMSVNPDDCQAIVDAVKAHKVMLSVCHVLRYTPYTVRLKNLLDSGVIGDICSIQHLEPVGYWHQAHAFVRGNWSKEAVSAPMLMSKACHDLDWLRYLAGKSCLQISSFGQLSHFRQEQKPAGGSDRCLDCKLSETCPYSAQNIYLYNVYKPRVGNNTTEKLFVGGSVKQWPWDVLTPEPSYETIIEALRTGPYGRCVYACDNDVVDHQVVNMQFEGGMTASFTMTAFIPMTDRKTSIFGSRGRIEGDGRKLYWYDFLSRTETVYDTHAFAGSSAAGGHAGGDEALMKAFVAAVANNDPSYILSGPDETMESHRMVFAAEQARRENRVISLQCL